MVDQKELELARKTAETMVAFIQTEYPSARLLDVHCEENALTPLLPAWVADVVVGEKDGQAQWNMPDGRRAYAHTISVPIQPVERAMFEAAIPAQRIIEEYKRLMFEPPGES